MQQLLDIKHAYTDKNIWLDVWIVRDFQNEASGREGQVIAWFELSELKNLDFPAANQAILNKLLAQTA